MAENFPDDRDEETRRQLKALGCLRWREEPREEAAAIGKVRSRDRPRPRIGRSTIARELASGQHSTSASSSGRRPRLLLVELLGRPAGRSDGGTVPE